MAWVHKAFHDINPAAYDSNLIHFLSSFPAPPPPLHTYTPNILTYYKFPNYAKCLLSLFKTVISSATDIIPRWSIKPPQLGYLPLSFKVPIFLNKNTRSFQIIISMYFSIPLPVYRPFEARVRALFAITFPASSRRTDRF